MFTNNGHLVLHKDLGGRSFTMLTRQVTVKEFLHQCQPGVGWAKFGQRSSRTTACVTWNVTIAEHLGLTVLKSPRHSRRWRA